MTKKKNKVSKTISKISISILSLVAVLPFLQASMAQAAKTTTVSSKIENPISPKTLGDLFGTMTGAFVSAIGLLSIVALIYGGLVYITSAGNEENINKGKKITTYAVVGLGVALLAYVIVNFVINTLLGGKGS